MTPQELLRIAKNINPEKLATNPQAAVGDAYIVAEAFRLAEMEKVIGSQLSRAARALVKCRRPTERERPQTFCYP